MREQLRGVLTNLVHVKRMEMQPAAPRQGGGVEELQKAGVKKQGSMSYGRRDTEGRGRRKV